MAREHVGAGGKAGEFQDLMRLAARLPHGRGAHQRADDDIVDHAHGLEALDHLEGAADAALATLGRRHAGDVLAIEPDRAFGRPHHARDQVEHRRLTGTVRTDQADDLAAADRDRDVAVGDEARKALGDAAGFEQSRHGATALRRRENSSIRPCGCASEISTISVP